MSQPCPLPSFLRTLLHWCRNPGRKPERRCHHVLTIGIAICGCHPVARGTPPRTSQSADGHEGRPGEEILCPRPEPAGGPRAVPELDGPGGSGRWESNSPGPAHPHAGTEDGAAGWPGGVPRPLRKDRGGMWVATNGLASWLRSSCQSRTSWSTTTWNEPSSSGSAGAPSSTASAFVHWSWGRTAGPSWWLTSSGTPAADGCWPGKVASTMSSTRWCWSSLLRGSLRRPRSGSSATARRRWIWPSNSPRTRWWRAMGLVKPYHPSLSLSPPLLCLPLSSFPGPVPAWFLEPSLDGEEDRHRSRRPGEPTPGRRGQPARAPRSFPFLRGLHANSLSHFPPLGWRGSLGRPVGVAGTQATSSIGVQWWRWGHWSGFRTPHRLPPIKLAGTKYLWVLGEVLIGLWWIQDVTRPRSIKA